MGPQDDRQRSPSSLTLRWRSRPAPSERAPARFARYNVRNRSVLAIDGSSAKSRVGPGNRQSRDLDRFRVRETIRRCRRALASETDRARSARARSWRCRIGPVTILGEPTERSLGHRNVVTVTISGRVTFRQDFGHCSTLRTLAPARTALVGRERSVSELGRALVNRLTGPEIAIVTTFRSERSLARFVKSRDRFGSARSALERSALAVGLAR